MSQKNFKVRNGLTVNGTEVIDSDGKLDWARLKNKADATTGTAGNLSASDKSKLDGIAPNADVTPIKDEDAMTSNSSTHVPSQQSTKAYVDNSISNLINAAPAALNTLDELAAALGDDANYAATTTTALGNRYTKAETDAKIVELAPATDISGKLDKSGGTMTGTLRLNDNTIWSYTDSGARHHSHICTGSMYQGTGAVVIHTNIAGPWTGNGGMFSITIQGYGYSQEGPIHLQIGGYSGEGNFHNTGYWDGNKGTKWGDNIKFATDSNGKVVVILGAENSANVYELAVTDFIQGFDTDSAEAENWTITRETDLSVYSNQSVINNKDSHVVSGSTPSNPRTGDTWFDTSTGVNAMKVWSGTNWDQMSNKFSATGGDSIGTTATHKYHIFTSSGSFNPEGSGAVDVMIQGGGGGANGGNSSGGAGGGGMVIVSGHTVGISSYTITIGAGGAGGSSQVGNNGSDSSAFGFTAKGGGTSGNRSNPSDLAPAQGGCGGGAGGPSGNPYTSGAASNQPSVGTHAYGNAGGNSNLSDDYEAGGGGGTGSAGGNSNSTNGGSGGSGRLINWDGNNYYYGAGGGGATYTEAAGNGGIGGGGGGGNFTPSGSGGSGGGSARNAGQNGTLGNNNPGEHIGGDGGANTGSGGGGAYLGLGGDGGSGIVIIRYAI